jgi:hypothetical protein
MATGSLALDDEPERVLGVPVHRRVLARVEVLDRRPQRRHRVGGAAEARVGQRDRSPLPAPPDGDQVAGALGQLQQVAPAPYVRLRGGGRAVRHEVADLGPQRDEQLGLEAAVELLQLGRRHRLAGTVDGVQGHRGDHGGHAGHATRFCLTAAIVLL